MLSQHLITKPVFDALFEGYDFAASNPVSQVMETMIHTLEGNNLSAETDQLNDFYASVARRASGIENAEGKQRIITELYENFFKQAFPKQADALGVVYTPTEVIDFIIRAVDDLSIKHFGAGLTEDGVHVLEAFMPRWVQMRANYASASGAECAHPAAALECEQRSSRCEGDRVVRHGFPGIHPADW